MTTCIDVSKSALTDLLSGSHPTDGLTPDPSVGPIDARVVHAVPLGFGVHIERVRTPWIDPLERSAKPPMEDVRDGNREHDQLIQR